MCFQIQAGTDNVTDWQYCCRMTSTSQNTSACKNRHPLGRVQETPGSGPQTVWCVHHTTNGVHVPHRHHHKPDPAGKMALLLQSGCPCSVRPTLGPTGFCTAPLGHPETKTPYKRSGWNVMQRVQKKSSSSLVEQWDHKTGLAPETDGTTIVTISAAIVIYRHKNVVHLETQSELPN